MQKDYNKIRLVNGVVNAINEALADIAITGIECKIEQYKNGYLTANEFLQYLEDTQKTLKGVNDEKQHTRMFAAII
jgi:hypothetical protein